MMGGMGAVFAVALSHSTTRAQETPTRFDYALDEQTELTLEPIVDDPRSWEMDLRRYGTAEQGTVLRYMGSLKETAPGVYAYQAEGEEKAQTVRVAGQPGRGQPLQVTGQRLVTEKGVAAKVDGEYAPLTSAQRLARAKQRWEKADAVLNQVYAGVKGEVGKAGETKLRDFQRGQIQRRDDQAEYDAIDHREHPTESAHYWDTMLTMTADNIAFLKIYSGRNVPKGLTGSYRDGKGGHLDLEETPKGLKFSIEVVRGRSSHTGEIAGVARLKGNSATFKDVLDREALKAGQKAGEITFSMRDGHIVHLDAKNTQDYGGANAYFDGDYYKAGKLQKPIDVAE